MNRAAWLQSLSYVAVAILSVGAALLISLQFIGGSRAQTSDATVPPDATATSEQGEVPAGDVVEEGQKAMTDLEGFLEPFIYDMVNRRDPFKAYSEYDPEDSSAPLRPMSPAQRFDLEQLQLVGIMWDVKDPRAMFLDPDKEVLILGRDEGIGNRNGYIAAIREGEVVVVEAARRRGEIIYKTRVLRIER